MSKYTYDEQKMLFTQIKFLIRRIENDVDLEEALTELIEKYRSGNVEFDMIDRIITTDMINKAMLFNTIAVACYNEELYDDVIPMLNKAIEFDKENDEYKFNMGQILYSFGEKQLALKYVNMIRHKNEFVRNFIEQINTM